MSAAQVRVDGREWFDEAVWYGTEPLYRTKHALAMPNEALRAASSTGDLGLFLSIGEAWVQIALQYMPQEHPAVADIGCGCGKMARFLMLHPGVRYTGLDIFKPAIDWCSAVFPKLFGDRATFVHLDAHSTLYNPQGAMPADHVIFPLQEACMDFVICGSLFTHLLEPEMHRYLEQCARILKTGGRLLASIHADPPDGIQFSGDARRIDMTSEFFVNSALDAGLSLVDHIGNLYDQQVYLFERT